MRRSTTVEAGAWRSQSSAAKYTYKNYVYRAYTYIKYTDDQGNTQIKLCDKPAYFTMYDEATAICCD